MGSDRRLTLLVRRIRGRRWRQRLHAPTVQVVAAVGVMVGGAALIGAWMVGVVLMAGGLLVAGDALLRDVPDRPAKSHEDVLERYRRAR